MDRVLHPSLLNSLVPTLLKHFFRLLVWSIPAAIAVTVLSLFGVGPGPAIVVGWWLLAVLIAALLRISVRTLLLHNTEYHFTDSSVTRRLEFFVIKSHAAPYRSITDVRVEESIWDRLTGAGDVIVHTAEDNQRDIRLHALENPEQVAQWLQRAASRSR